MINKLINKLLIFIFLGLMGGQEEGSIIISEFFTKSGPGTYLPDFFELYNSTNSSIDINGWGINGEIIELQTEEIELNGEDVEVEFNLETIIPPKGYMIIAGINDPFYNSYGNTLFAGYNLPNSIYLDLSLSHNNPDTIIVVNGADTLDWISFSQDPDDGIPGWPGGDENRGYSIQLDDPNNDNTIPENWSVSPETAISNYLYDEDGSESVIKNFGTPGEENCFSLISPSDGDTLFITGDIYSNNNYSDPIELSWEGTFSNDGFELDYQVYIEKEGDSVLTLNLGEVLSFSIFPEDLLINQLQSGNYSWKVDLFKGEDVVHSNQYSFSVDASAYGNYGCMNPGACNYNAEANIDDGNCDLESCVGCMDDGNQSWSNYPVGCTPGADCLPALNYSLDVIFSCPDDCCQYVTLSVPFSTLGYKDSLIYLPVLLENDDGVDIESIQYVFEYDSDILQYESSTLDSTILELWNYSLGSESDDDQVSIEINFTSSLYPNGGIITRHLFRIIGNFGQSSNLTLSDLSMNGSSILGVNGSFLVQGEFEIAGNISYYQQGGPSGGIPILGVELNLLENSNEEWKDTTNTQGNYHFSGIINGYYTLTPQKTGDLGGLSGVDASRIARFSVGDPSVNFNPLQELAADVTLNGFVSGMDASRVARYTVDIIDSLNDEDINWIFNPGFYDYTDPPLSVDEFSQNFVGMRLGDVSGNWTADTPNSQYRGKEQREFIELSLKIPDEISFPITLMENHLVEGLDLIIRYDSGIMESHGFEINNDLFPGEVYHYLINEESPGRIIVSVWAAVPPINVSGQIGYFKANWLSTDQNGKIWLEKANVNDETGQIEFEFADSQGSIFYSSAVSLISELLPEKLMLLQNFPNPFNPLTSIGWVMPEGNVIKLAIYNLRGEEIVLLHNGFMQAGSHQLIWNANNFSAGIYFTKLEIAGKSLQKKMILLK